MDAFAKALLFMLPAFFLMIIIEATYAKAKGRFNFRSMDVISSLSAGMTNALTVSYTHLTLPTICSV